MHARATLLVLLGSLALAGCLAGAANEPASPLDARTASPSSASAGEGSSTLRVLVTDEPGGPPLAGANVVADDGSTSAAALTGDGGVAELHVAAHRDIALSAWRSGFTLERLRDVTSPAAEETKDVEVPLFHEQVTVTLHGTLQPAGASTRALDKSSVRWEPRPLEWSEASPRATRMYDQRLVLANATLTWTNSPTGDGDLLLAAGRSASHADAVQDSPQEQFGLGEQAERTSVPFAAISRAGWRSADVLYVGAGTGKAWAAPLGLDYTIVVEARFDGDLALHDSPNDGGVAALLALAGAALVVRRRG